MPALLDGSLDIAVMFDAPAFPRLLIEELTSVPFLMVASRDMLNATEAILSDYIDVDWGESFSVAFQHHFGPMYPAKLHTSVGKVALELILKIGGVAYLPKPMILPLLQGGELFVVHDAPVIIRPVFAVRLAGSQQNPDLNHAVEQMRSCLNNRLE